MSQGQGSAAMSLRICSLLFPGSAIVQGGLSGYSGSCLPVSVLSITGDYPESAAFGWFVSAILACINAACTSRSIIHFAQSPRACENAAAAIQ